MPVFTFADNHSPPVDAVPRSGELVIFDLEFTAWPGSLARRWAEPWEYREVIQIGAIRVDAADWRELGAFERIVKPLINPSLSDHIQNLTGITEAVMAEQGVDYAGALNDFAAFVGTESALLSNGIDGHVLRENCDLQGLTYPFSTDRAGNVRQLLSRVTSLASPVLVSSQLPELLGLPAPREKHGGLADARSIAVALAELRRRGLI